MLLVFTGKGSGLPFALLASRVISVESVVENVDAATHAESTLIIHKKNEVENTHSFVLDPFEDVVNRVNAALAGQPDPTQGPRAIGKRQPVGLGGR